MLPEICLSKICLSKIGAAIAPVVLVASVAVSLGASPAAAAAHRDRHAASATHRGQSVRTAGRWHHRSYLVRRSPMPIYDYDHPNPSAGYVFIPGKGIAGESCNMPTSTCTNEYRDVQ
jgi:hypothetical protein